MLFQSLYRILRTRIYSANNRFDGEGLYSTLVYLLVVSDLCNNYIPNCNLCTYRLSNMEVMHAHLDQNYFIQLVVLLYNASLG